MEVVEVVLKDVFALAVELARFEGEGAFREMDRMSSSSYIDPVRFTSRTANVEAYVNRRFTSEESLARGVQERNSLENTE